MSITTFFRDRLAFTRNEMKAVLILCGTFLIGLVIRWVQTPSHPPPSSVPGQTFDYRQTDSEFVSRSHALLAVPGADHPKNVRFSSMRKPSIAPHSVNINTASKEQLMRLSGIGESFALRIIQYRAEHGPFASIADLEKVRGIGPKKLERLRPFVTVK